jgi:hypothetical protein
MRKIGLRVCACKPMRQLYERGKWWIAPYVKEKNKKERDGDRSEETCGKGKNLEARMVTSNDNEEKCGFYFFPKSLKRRCTIK